MKYERVLLFSILAFWGLYMPSFAQYPYTLTVEPVNAHVELSRNGEKQLCELIDGQAQLNLLEGVYDYIITAEKHKPEKGMLVVDSLHLDTIIALKPRFGWITVSGDSADLAGLSVKIEHYREETKVPLPIEKMQCGLGTHTLTIQKPKYLKWKQKIMINYGDHVELTPVLQLKEYATRSFVLAEGGVSMNHAWAVGLMLGQIYGEVTQFCGVGWYINGRSNFQTTQPADVVQISVGGYLGNLIPAYTGNKRFTEWNLNAGVVVNFLNKKSLNIHNNTMLGIYAGMGYGQYTRYWEIEDGSWFEYAPSLAKGVSFGGGVIGSIKGFTISAGVNSIMAKHLEIEFGLGWTFSGLNKK